MAETFHMTLRKKRTRKTPDLAKSETLDDVEVEEEKTQCCAERKPGCSNIQCSVCDAWYHIDCVNVSPDQWSKQDELSDGEETKEEMWKCSMCSDNIREESDEPSLRSITQLLLTLSQQAKNDLIQVRGDLSLQRQQAKDDLIQVRNDLSLQQQQIKEDLSLQQQQIKEDLSLQQRQMKEEIVQLQQGQMKEHLLQVQEEIKQHHAGLKEEMTVLVKTGIQDVAEELRTYHHRLCEQVMSHVQEYEEKAVARLSSMEEKVEKQATLCQHNQQELIVKMTTQDLQVKKEVLDIATHTIQMTLDGVRERMDEEHRKSATHMRHIEQQHALDLRHIENNLEVWKGCIRKNAEDIHTTHTSLTRHEERLNRIERNILESSLTEEYHDSSTCHRDTERMLRHHSDEHLECKRERGIKSCTNKFCKKSFKTEKHISCSDLRSQVISPCNVRQCRECKGKKKKEDSSSDPESGYSEPENQASPAAWKTSARQPRSYPLEFNNVRRRLWKEEEAASRRRQSVQHHRSDRSGEDDADITSRPARVKVRLADLRSFTQFPTNGDEVTASSFLTQLEREATLVGIPTEQMLEIIPFVLRGNSLSWFYSHSSSFQSYGEFKRQFISYYQSEDVVCSQVTRLRTSPFNPKLDKSVQYFVTDRYRKLRDLDTMSSEAQICNNIISLLPVTYQKQLVSVKCTKLMDLLDIVRKLEIIHDASEQRRPNVLRGKEEDYRGKPLPVHAVSKIETITPQETHSEGDPEGGKEYDYPTRSQYRGTTRRPRYRGRPRRPGGLSRGIGRGSAVDYDYDGTQDALNREPGSRNERSWTGRDGVESAPNPQVGDPKNDIPRRPRGSEERH